MTLAITSAGVVGGTVFSDSVAAKAFGAEDDHDVDVTTLAPAKQVAMGVDPLDVTCQGEHLLLIRTNGDPICVTSASSERLITMGIAAMPEPRSDSDDDDDDDMTGKTTMTDVTVEKFDADMDKLVVSMTRLSDTFDVMMQDVMDVTGDAVELYESGGTTTFESITASADTYDAGMPYLFVLDYETMDILAHGFDSESVGASSIPTIETGKKSIDMIKEELDSEGSTWMMYTAENPANGKGQVKKSYIELHDGHIFGSGFYLSDLEAEMIVTRWIANDAAEMYDERGDAALDAITEGAATHDGSEVYAFVSDIETKALVAHGADAEKVGNPSTILAGNANKMVDQILAEIGKNDGTWVSYEFTNPETGEDAYKVSWLTVRDNYLFGAGFYPDEHTADKVRAIMSTDMALAMYAADGDDAFEDITALNVEESWYPFVIGYEDMIEYADGSVLDRSGAPVWDEYEHAASLFGIRDTLEAGNGAFTTYVFLNPETDEVQAKKSWYVLHDGYVFGAGNYLTGDYASKAYAKWSAAKALEMYTADGIDATINTINSMNGTGETYPFVLDSEFVIVANGADIKYVGMNAFEAVSNPDKDAQQIITDIGLSPTMSTWWTYEFVHPETGETGEKKTILIMHDDYIFGAGYYPTGESHAMHDDESHAMHDDESHAMHDDESHAMHDDESHAMHDDESHAMHDDESHAMHDDESHAMHDDKSDSMSVVSMTRLSDTFDVMMQDVMDVTGDAVELYESDGTAAFESITASADTYDAGMPYLFVLDYETMDILAHGFDSESVGASSIPTIETGKKSIDTIKEELDSEGSTWMMYTAENPANGKDQVKKSYIELHDGHIFGSGFYLSDLEAEMIVTRWIANDAAEMYDERGDAALDAITEGAATHDGSEVYAFVSDIETKALVAHGADADNIGTPSIILNDEANKMTDQILAEIDEHGETWVSYEFTNFETGEDAYKVSWLTVRDNYLFGAGFYPDEHTADKVRAIMSTDMALAMYAADGDDAFEDITALNVEESWYPFVIGYEDMIEYADGSVLDRSGAPVWDEYEHAASLFGIRDTLEAGNGAFTTYVFLNPETDEVQAKKSWYVLHDGYVFGAGNYLTGDYASKAYAKWSAAKALEMYTADGIDATIGVINAMETADETYPFVLDSDFLILANGADTQYVGKNSFDVISNPEKNAEQIMTDIRLSPTMSTWSTYEFVHPETGETGEKKAILIMHDDYIFGAGYYPTVEEEE